LRCARQIEAHASRNVTLTVQDQGRKTMATTTQQNGNTRLYEPLDPRQLASQKLARAASDVEAALLAFGTALRERAQIEASELTSDLKRRLGSAEHELETLLSRVPALGPFLATQLSRATHPGAKQQAPATAEATPLEPGDTAPTMADYLDCIGCHVA
jgi:hypothetical protein